MATRDIGGGPRPQSLGDARAADARPAAGARQHRTRQHAPWDKLTERRAAPPGYDARDALVAQLREANQNLVLATIKAQTLRDEAEAANQRQNEFLAMLAHELRNPLAAISVAAGLIGKAPDASPMLSRLQGIVGRQVGHLSRLLDDLLDAARISSGKITLQAAPLALADVIARAIEAVQPSLDARRQQLTLEAPAAPVGMVGDLMRLTQVFTNLLANASKFTQDRGRIQIRVTAALARQVEVAVSDNGEGMAAQVLPHIFDLFAQGPRSLARSEGGLGIGLSIARNIVQMHGGTVTASSEGPGRGSVFTVTLPAAAVPSGAAAPAPAAGAPRRVLVIDDNADACEALKMALELERHTVSTACDGAAGLALMRAHAYDVVVCDIGMPEMNGIELVLTLRASATGALPLLLALSGYGQAQDRASALAAGFDDYFVKPVAVDALLAAIAAHGATLLPGGDAA